jgi:transcriptional regulator with XRE-family HTH domain
MLSLDARGMKREELAEKGGLTLDKVDKIIDQGHIPEPDVRGRIAEILQVSERYLFGSEDQVETFLNSEGHWQKVKARLGEAEDADLEKREGGEKT